ncbi:MAG: class I tRNA ligase family protein, partial [Rhizobiales bacterium]|nr:class I tRNA ligase family protein [Hyphomicrobiales bacterium]
LEPFGGGLSCDDPQKNTFDIHGGGIDLVFPHHENEIAQSCCAFDAPRMANIWMHNGFLQVEGEKMSKSLGNFVTIRELLETGSFGSNVWHGYVLRFAMLTTHYRQPIDFTAERLVEARKQLADWIHFVRGADPTDSNEPPAELVEKLADDLNFSEAKALMAAWARQKGDVEAATKLSRSMRFLGLWNGEASAEIYSYGHAVTDGPADAEIEAYIAARLDARRAKNFAEADRIRAELDGMGILLKDAKDPATGEIVTTWEVKR